jgi:hypothetical protein
MIIHIVNHPFLCREGQFNEGKRDLCVGLDYNALKATEEFWCYLGNNRKVHFEIASAEAMRVGQQWRNPSGKTVFIVPINAFKMVRVEFNQEEYDKKEEHREKVNQQQSLL